MILRRENCFETNSSSTHALTVMSSDEYDKWTRNETYYNAQEDEFVNATDTKFLDHIHVKYDKTMFRDGAFDPSESEQCITKHKLNDNEYVYAVCYNNPMY